MRKTGKRITLLLVTLLLSLSLLAGCGGAPEDSTDLPDQTAETAEQAYETDDTGEADSSDVTKDTPAIEEDGVYTSKEDTQPTEPAPAIDEDGAYYGAEDVALYLYTYEKLPDNFITKKEAQKLGWEGGSLEPYAPGMCIGGDRFGNYEGTLPEDVSYHECDIDTLGKKSRGAKRIVYSEDWEIYYTDDHYETFEQLY